MVKSDLVNALSEMDYCKNQANIVISDIFRVIATALVNGESVKIHGFGTFQVKKHKGHPICDVHTGQRSKAEDYIVIKFKPGDNLRDALRSGDPSKLNFLSRTEAQ